MTTYAQINMRSAFLWTDFGLQMAQRYFTPEELAKLPRFVRGKRAGHIKGQITWCKVESGGWVNDQGGGHVENRIGKVIDCQLQTAEWGEQPKTIAHWKRV